MPSGLPSVEQSFSAETSGYIAGIARMIKGNEELIGSIRNVKREITGLGAALAALPDKRVKVEVTGVAQAIGEVEALQRALDGLGDKHVHVGGDNGEMVRHLKDISTYMDMATDSMGRMEEHLTTINRNVADSSASLDMHTQILRDHAAAYERAAESAGRYSRSARDAGGGDRYYIRMAGARDASAQARDDAAAAYYTARTAQLAAGGGGGGGQPGGRGAFIPWAGGGFQAVKFWGMAIAEFAATAVPALMAAGAAATVGMQGAQDVILRAKSLSTTVDALGPAYGVTLGSYLGTGGALGRAQDTARGGVYELAGAGINFAQMGKGAFSRLGLNTIAMMDRGAASMLVNYQNRQKAGGGLADLLGGGTEWLRRYGDLGANIGDTIMNLAPYEPGIGGDVLNTLVGGTGFLKQATQDIPGPLLGAIMALEGGQRWGKAILGGKGLLGRVLGLGKVGGIGGLLSKGGEKLFTRGAGGFLGDLGLGMMGGGDALATAAGPIGDVAALSAYTMAWLASTMPSPAMRQMAGLQAGIGQAGFTGAWQPLAHAITTATGLASNAPTGIASMMGTMQSPSTFARFGPVGPTTQQVYANAATGFAQQMGDLANAGPDLVKALHKAGLKSVSMADAFQIAQNALLDTSHAFGPDGHLTQKAQQMVTSYVTGTPGFTKMTGVSGAFVAADAAQYVMSRPEMKSLSQVNQAMDSMTQIMTGGPSGMAALFGMLGGTPTTTKRGGLKLQAPPAIQKMAQALTSFTTAGGAAAWQQFSGPQGFVAAEQQNLDQLRTYMTLGALGPGQAAGIAGFQIQQLLPMAKKSPAALAMLMQQGAQMGIGGYYTGDPSKPGVQAANYATAVAAFGKMAASAHQVNAYMNSAVAKVSNLPQAAQQFTKGTNADVQSQLMAQASTDLMKLRSASLKGVVDKSSAADLVNLMKTAGIQGGQALKSSVDTALKQAGVSAGMRRKIEWEIDLKVKADAAKAAADKLKAALGGADHQVTFKAHADVGQAKSQLASVEAGRHTVTFNSRLIPPHVPTLYGTVIYNAVIAGGGTRGQASLAAGNIGKTRGFQTGGLVPGFGSGDHVPLLAEPGEAVVPRNLVPLIAPILRAHHVPGFAAGGIVGGIPHRVYEHFEGSSITLQLKGFAVSLIDAITQALKTAGAQKIASALVDKIRQEISYAKNVAASAKQGVNFAGMDLSQNTVTGNMRDYLKSVRDFTKDLKTLTGQGLDKGVLKQLIDAGPVIGEQLAQSIMHGMRPAMAKQISQQAVAGLNLGGMDLTQGSVLQQMQGYSSNLGSFTKDVKSLEKGGLNKKMIQQILDAGPAQGDLLAQSILGGGGGGIKDINALWKQIGSQAGQLGAAGSLAYPGGGGVKNVNQLWKQLGIASNALGAQAGMSVYGGVLAPNLKSGSFTTNHVVINVASKGGQTLDLSPAQIKKLVEEIQAALLRQARRNQKTGLQPSGKGA